jgi:hypothetical protein
MRHKFLAPGRTSDRHPQSPLADSAHRVEDVAPASPSLVPEAEKWETEKRFRERELALKEAELKLKRDDHASSGWRSPLVVAILAAALAAAGNAVVTIVNSRFERDLDDRRAEHERILEMLKAGSPDKAAANLKFLLNLGLISDASLATNLKSFLDVRAPGTGPAVNSGSSTSNAITPIPPIVEGGASIGTTFQNTFTRNGGSLVCVNEFVKVSATEWRERPSSNDPSGCLTDSPNFRYTERTSDDPHYILLYDEGRSLLAHITNTERGQAGPTAWRLISDPTWNSGGSLTRIN